VSSWPRNEGADRSGSRTFWHEEALC
jgi:hypothetical protein